MKTGNEPLPEFVTVSQMARAIGLSRSRFYALLAEGVFPQPLRTPETMRPYFSQEQQQQVLDIRRRCCGLNGRIILFYDRPVRRDPSPPTIRRPKPESPRPKRTDAQGSARPTSDPVLQELCHGLSQLGVQPVTDVQIRAALAEECPDGWRDRDQATLLRAVFRRLKCQEQQP